MGLPLLIKLMKPQFAEQFLATASLHFEMFEKFKQMEQEDNDTEMGDAHEATAIRKFNPDTTTFFVSPLDSDGNSTEVIKIEHPHATLMVSYSKKDEAGIASFYVANLENDLQEANLKSSANAWRLNDETLNNLSKIQSTDPERVPLVILDYSKFIDLLRKKDNLMWGNTRYYDPNNWYNKQTQMYMDQEYQILFSKQNRYAYQHEFRIAIPSGLSKSIELELGSAKSFAKIVTLEELRNNFVFF
ncbi:hypothetical protein [Lactiplantibacillus plantarum]|uniref:hypothetical protein n=4 Tax=Lactiplantibacillus plantarum TaxID=1590 RepID=UPI0016A03B88|nr:hypothetical protein [Lactiplantibacillus plantarum]MCT4451151.1 hypothetical protein [Lactiplantibacillus plantarum]MCT4458804.1 hypothetical protein [Lactiplantibacillus plantarum]NLS62724.1 hypothetical protein [Lactiplantibacillus plantarum]